MIVTVLDLHNFFIYSDDLSVTLSMPALGTPPYAPVAASFYLLIVAIAS